MKRLILLAFVFTACGCTNNTLFNDGDNLPNRPQTIFEGTWTWLKTDGSGIAGPYETDSTKTGYSVRYKFGFTEVEVFHNKTRIGKYAYTFTVADISNNPKDQILTFKSLTTGEVVNQYLWAATSNEDGFFMTLSNVEECCDNNFTQYLKRISSPDLGAVK